MQHVFIIDNVRLDNTTILLFLSIVIGSVTSTSTYVTLFASLREQFSIISNITRQQTFQSSDRDISKDSFIPIGRSRYLTGVRRSAQRFLVVK